MSVLLQTPHGSHLYGLAHAGSDLDTFMVLATSPTKKARYAKQHISEVDGQTLDVTTTDLSTFVLYASKGVPQYLEAMWSNQATVDEINDMRFAFRPNYYVTTDTYQRTIKNFWDAEDTKRKRHAYRLTLNLLDMREYGIFDPTLDEEHLERLNDMMTEFKDPKEYLQ